MLSEIRELYKLEKLWDNAVVVNIKKLKSKTEKITATKEVKKKTVVKKTAKIIKKL